MKQLHRHAGSLWVPLVMFAAAAVLAAGCPAPGPEDAPPADGLPAEQKPAAEQPLDSPPTAEPQTPAEPADAVNTPLENTSPTEPTADAGEETVVPAEPADEETSTGGYGKSSGETDFVALNGKIFEGWQKPRAALLFSGQQQGYIEACGCAGLDKKKGGVSRRHTLLKQLKEQGWPVEPLEMGGLVRRIGSQAELKYNASTDALHKMGYQVVGFGGDDLRLPPTVLISTIKDFDSPHFVSANVGVLGFDSGMAEPFKLIEVGDMKFAVTTVLADSQRAKLSNEEISTKPAADALPPIVEQMKTAGADKLVLLVSGEPEEAQQLAKQFADFDVVVAPGHSDPPPMNPSVIEGTETQLIELSHKGMYVGVLGFYDDEQQPVRYQRVPLDGRFEDSPAMYQVMVNYQDQLKALGWEGLGIKPLPAPGGHEFIGSQTCADCHTTAHDIWSGTPHGHALATLEKLDPPRQFDAECISCHVVGWEPQKYVPYVGGFVSRDKTPELVDQGCENCHGGGREHALIELGELDADRAKQDAARAAMRVTLSTEEGKTKVLNNCLQCHDLDNSPDFDFDTYWPQVEHEGLD